ncbi:MAG: leucine-rich repeat domain-containing protein, partial [Clostridia bacterium]|nr:leucine-rich repeat domain-containing protein [Clostridia bacterium]
IPSSVNSLGTGVLSQCGYLREVDMSGYAGTNLPMWAFESCDNLSYVKLPETIKSIYEYAFSGCTSLTNIEIPKNTTNFAAGVFYNTGLTEFTFNSGVTEVSNDMFSGCTDLERVVLADTITFIGSYAFSGCTSLSYLYLPNSVFENERFVDDAGGGYYDYTGCIGCDAFSECKIETIDAESIAYSIVLYSLASNEYNARNPVTHNYTKLNIVYKD